MAAAKSEYRFSEKRNGKFIVRKKGGKMVNGEEKTKALIQAGKVKKLKAKAKPAADAAAEA